MNRKQMATIAGGIVLLVAATAGASAFITQKALQPDKPAAVQKETITWNQSQAAAPAQKNCDDGNIVGKVVGGVGGGVLGSQIGNGSGKTAGTIAGTLGGAYVGGKYIPTDNVTCAK